MRFIPRSRLAAIGLAGVLALGLVGTAGVALAEDAPVPGIQQLRKGRHHRAVAVGIKHLVEASGLDRAVVAEGLKNGDSLATIFEANGVDTDAVIAEVLADLDARLDEKVAAGDLTADQAAKIQEKAEEALPRLANAENLRRHVGRHILKHELRIAAETIGIPVEDLVSALRGGETIADVAVANGSSAQEVIDAMVAPIDARIDRAVAAGKIDAARGAELKTRALERITTLVNEGRPAR